MVHTLFIFFKWSARVLCSGFFSTYLPTFKREWKQHTNLFRWWNSNKKTQTWKDVVLKCWLHHPRFFVENSLDWHLKHWSHWYYRYIPYNIHICLIKKLIYIKMSMPKLAKAEWEIKSLHLTNRLTNNDWTRLILARSSISEYPILWVNWAGFKESLYWLNIIPIITGSAFIPPKKPKSKSFESQKKNNIDLT